MDDEKWLPIPGYEGLYEVSDLGRVKSLEKTTMKRNRWGVFPRRLPEIIKKPRLIVNGNYKILCMTIWKDGKPFKMGVHGFVTWAFLGPCPDGYQVAYWDGDGTNNKLSNLRYATAKENAKDRDRHGSTARGMRSGGARLSQEDVMEIRSILGAERQVDIATKFGVSQTVISSIKTGKTWGWLA